jgi:hypothetical protein
MKPLLNQHSSFFHSEADAYGLRHSTTVAIVIFPFIVVTLFVFLGTLSATRPAVLWTLRENRPVELLTFAMLIVTSITGFRFAKFLKKSDEQFSSVVFVWLFSIIFFIIAMEEIAWGQWFFHFKSPDFFQQFNRQGETTLHNIGFLQGRSEFFRLAFGVAGITGLSFSSSLKSRNFDVPLLLVPYILIITFFSGIDLYGDFSKLPEIVDRGAARLSEVVEMLIAITALLYFSLKFRSRRFGSTAKRKESNSPSLT